MPSNSSNITNRMKKIINIVLLSVVLPGLVVSCKHKTDDEHLPPAIMRKVLLDVNLAESYSIVAKDSLHKGGTKNLDSLSAWYKDIFAHYKITESEFTQSLNWYKNHPEEIDSLYGTILPIVNRLQGQSGKN